MKLECIMQVTAHTRCLLAAFLANLRISAPQLSPPPLSLSLTHFRGCSLCAARSPGPCRGDKGGSDGRQGLDCGGVGVSEVGSKPAQGNVSVSYSVPHFVL